VPVRKPIAHWQSDPTKKAPQRWKASRSNAIHHRIVELMKAHPEGVSGGQIQKERGISPEEQTHLDKRKRE
jgi:hypothetical protein